MVRSCRIAAYGVSVETCARALAAIARPHMVMARRSSTASASSRGAPGVSTVIPGARNPEQVSANAAAASLAPLREDQLDGVRAVRDRLVRAHVEPRW